MPESRAIVGRLCRLKENRGATWNQLAEDLGISLSMALMVKSGARVLGKAALAKLEVLEGTTPNLPPPPAKEKAAVSGRERVRLTALDRQRGHVEIDVNYGPGVKATDLPRRIKVSRPEADAIETITKVLADTWEVKIAVIACLPRAWATEDYLQMLSTKSYLAIQSVALTFILGDRWRTLLAKAIVEGLIDTRSILDQVTRDQKQKG